MTYDFQCTQCKHSFEKVMTFKEYDTKKVLCPQCKSSQVRRVITRPAGIRFKGAGFYINDKDKK